LLKRKESPILPELKRGVKNPIAIHTMGRKGRKIREMALWTSRKSRAGGEGSLKQQNPRKLREVELLQTFPVP